jgi:ABC-type nitrate/sulfonate/bicarbonate transport system ATPase subunit
MVNGARRGALIEARGVRKSYVEAGRAPLLTLDAVDLVAAPGEFVALIGPSGAGKSTLFQILAGLDDADAGEIRFDGRSPASRLGVCAYMPQRDALLPWRRTIDNVTIGLELAGVRRARARERARPLLERFGLGGFESSWPWQLSGGMRQRAAFLRTVLLGRPAMLLDEPFGALDGITRGELQQWLLEVWSEVGSTVLLITHDVAEAVFLADRVYVMTPLPGTIATSIEIGLPRPRTLRIEESPEFAAHETRLREALRAGRAGPAGPPLRSPLSELPASGG